MIQNLRRMKQYIVNCLLPTLLSSHPVSSPETTLFIYSKYILSAYYPSGTFLGAGDRALNKTDNNSCPHGAYILVGKKRQ